MIADPSTKRYCRVCGWRKATAGSLCEAHALEAARLLFIQLATMSPEELFEGICLDKNAGYYEPAYEVDANGGVA